MHATTRTLNVVLLLPIVRWGKKGKEYINPAQQIELLRTSCNPLELIAFLNVGSLSPAALLPIVRGVDPAQQQLSYFATMQSS